MDAQSFIALTLWVMANVAVAKMRMRGYEKIVAYLTLLVLMFYFIPEWAPPDKIDTSYLIVAIVPLTLLLGDMAVKLRHKEFQRRV